MQKGSLSFNGFKHYLKNYILIEKEIAQRSEKMTKFIRKWVAIIENLGIEI